MITLYNKFILFTVSLILLSVIYTFKYSEFNMTLCFLVERIDIAKLHFKILTYFQEIT